MKRREIKFDNARDAANWMLNHPLERVYDEYNNYWVWVHIQMLLNIIMKLILKTGYGIWIDILLKNLLKILMVLK